MDIFISFTVAGFEHVEHHVRLLQDAQADLIAASVFLNETVAVLVNEDNLIGTVYITRRIF